VTGLLHRKRTTGIACPVLALLAAALAGCGERAPGDEAWARADAAIARGDLAAAEAAARDAAAHPERAALGAIVYFVRGSVAFARSERAEAAAALPDADPTLLDRAIADAEDALVAWRKAATSRDDWPAARRNVERAAIRLAALRAKKGGARPPPGAPDATPIPRAGKEGPSARAPGLPPPPPPPPRGGADPAAKPPSVEVTTSELPSGEVLGLLDVLRAKEREKQAARRGEQERRGGDVERDW